VLQHLIDEGITLHPEDDPSIHPLHAACRYGRVGTAQILLYSGIDVNVRDVAGGMPRKRATVGG